MESNELCEDRLVTIRALIFVRSYLTVFDDSTLVGWGRGGQGNKVRAWKKPKI